MNDIINEDVIEKVVIKSVAIYKAMSVLPAPPFEDKFVNKKNICQQNEIIQNQNLENCLNAIEPSKENEITDTTNEIKKNILTFQPPIHPSNRILTIYIHHGFIHYSIHISYSLHHRNDPVNSINYILLQITIKIPILNIFIFKYFTIYTNKIRYLFGNRRKCLTGKHYIRVIHIVKI